jgi:hypothetical protein
MSAAAPRSQFRKYFLTSAKRVLLPLQVFLACRGTTAVSDAESFEVQAPTLCEPVQVPTLSATPRRRVACSQKTTGEGAAIAPTGSPVIFCIAGLNLSSYSTDIG